MTVISNTMIKTRKIWLLALLLPTVVMADTPPDPKALLKSMCSAMTNSSYRGTFVHLHNNRMESMEIVRRKTDKGEVEKILSLNGEAREIIREGDKVTCILPQSRKVTVDAARPGSQLPLSLPHNLDNVESFYDLTLNGEERIAGMDAYIVTLKPKDTYRYGHRVWVDKMSRLMVKSDLLDGQGMPVEQLMFTKLSLQDELSDDVFKPTLEAENFERIKIGHNADELERHDLQWTLTQVPYGFTLVTQKRQTSPSTGEPMEHMLLSDGMASVSVFIEMAQGKVMDGVSRMGAVHAYGTRKGQYKVLVVGEVPAATVKLINQFVEPVSE